MSDYSKLTKKELLYTLLARDVMLKDCRERFELHKNTDAKTIQDQSDLIEELKAKLAESEIRSKESEIFYKREINRRDTKLRNIKQQLAEKDEEINVYKKYIKVEDQEKISFCIEQLEKVKELLYPELRFDYSLYLRAMHEIDNQIVQLTHQHEDKGD